jgi:hypothetical protein
MGLKVRWASRGICVAPPIVSQQPELAREKESGWACLLPWYPRMFGALELVGLWDPRCSLLSRAAQGDSQGVKT